jgi:hypothetical protein
MANSTKRRKRIFYGLIFIFAGMLVGGFLGNRWAKKNGYDNLWDFITTYGSNKADSWNANYQTLNIFIGEEDYATLEAYRADALERGIMINEGDNYVPATLAHNGAEIRAELRLKGHMMDHLQDKKWSFRVKTKKGDAFMGMKRFSLQHPGTRNYVHEWIYHRMMEEEGIMSLRYFFLNVRVNNEDWGIYALEEHFTEEMVENNARMKGPVVRYNPDMYWAFRIRELNGQFQNNDYDKSESSYIEPYESKSVFEDSSMREIFITCNDRIEGFRRGDLSSSEVFDVPKMAKFHAIIDLVGGHHSLDWSDVKYYYNAESQLIEPVAYESFSVRNTEQLAGSFRFIDDTSSAPKDHHSRLFSDTVFFAEYVKQLDRIATKKWTTNFFQKIDPELQSHLAILNKEFAYKKYSDKGYFKNAENIRQILAQPRAYYAHVEAIENDSVILAIGGLDPLPSIIRELQIDTATIVLPRPIVVPSKPQQQFVQYRSYAVQLPSGLKFEKGSKLTLKSTLPGRTDLAEFDVFPYPSYDASRLGDAYMHQQANADRSEFIVKDAQAKRYMVMPGKHVLKEDLIFPSGYEVLIQEGTSLELEKGVRIISFSPLNLQGSEENPIRIFSAEGKGEGLVLFAPGTSSKFRHVEFLALKRPNQGNSEHSSAVNLIQTNASFQHCSFAEIKASAVSAVSSNVEFKSCVFSEIKQDGLRIWFSNFVIEKCDFTNIGDDGIRVNNAYGRIHNVHLNKIGGKGIYVSDYASIRGINLKVKKAKCGFACENASRMILQQVRVEDAELGFKASHKGGVFGPASIQVSKMELKNVLQEKENAKGSKVIIREDKK